MNKERRNELTAIMASIERIRMEVEEVQGLLQGVADAEQEAFDNLPEGLQQAEKGQRTEEIASNLAETAYTLENIVSELEEANNVIEDCMS